MKVSRILCRILLLISGYLVKSLRIVKLTLIILLVGVINVFGVNSFSDEVNLSSITSNYPEEGQQQSQVTGTITDGQGNPLPGVTVLVKGTTFGTITDNAGKYTLSNVPPNSVLVFSFVGSATQEIPVNNRSVINVTMAEETVGLEEVVVIGYGSQRKVDLTGSVETIKSAEIIKQPVAQVSQALVGLTPGLTAIQSSGQPGRDYSTLRIRGTGSIGASNDPLILIDGVAGDINSINPNDIEDISILKDAAAAAIYGSRASNGVILITTKRAKSGKLSVNYSGYTGWQKPTGLPKFLKALDFLKYSGYSQEYINNYAAGMKSNPDAFPDTDWVDLLFSENGFQQSHNVSISGGAENIRSVASLAFVDQGSNIVNFNYKRYNGRINTDLKVTNKINVNFDLSFNRSQTSSPPLGLTYVTREVFRDPPICSAIHSDGTWGDGWQGQNGVAESRAGGSNTQLFNYFRGSLKINYNPFRDLRLSVMYTPEVNDWYNSVFTKQYRTIIDWETKTTRLYPSRNGLTQNNSNSFINNFNALVTYARTFSNHSLSALAGYEFIKRNYRYFDASRQDYTLQDYEVLNGGSAATALNNGSATQSGLVSYFGRVNYSFMDKYLVEANIRSDASSRFAKGNRVGIFPSFSAGWRLSEEPFIKNLGVFSNLKLRASWGQLGNQQIGSDFPYTSSISIGSNNFLFNNTISTGATQNVLANSAIKWETTATTNLGIDVGVLKQRLTLTAEYYIRKTKDILLSLPIPLVMGLSPSYQNAGNVENKGIDLSLGWRDAYGDFSYSAILNFSHVKNEVTNLSSVGPIISGNSITRVGSPIGSIYGFETAGIFQTQEEINGAATQFGTLIPGNLRYKDQNNDGKINSDDRVIIGNPFPTISFGINLGAQYKGFDLSVYLQGVGRRDVSLHDDAVWALFNAGKIQEWHVRECWSAENTDAKFPIIRATSAGSNDAQITSTWVFNAAYLRARNISFGYTLPNASSKISFINGLRVYFAGQNLFKFDKLPEGIDPMIPNDSDGSYFPINKNFTIGLDVQF